MRTAIMRPAALALVSMSVLLSVTEGSSPALAACSVDSNLQAGSRSGQVACLEARLVELGYDALRGPDLYFGSSTLREVIRFQTMSGLQADGIVGPRTRAALMLDERPVATVPPVVIEQRVIGSSVDGREITAYRMGTPGGRVVLVVGVIHGDEVKGAEITALLRTMPTPVGIDLWLIDSMNPDGQANGSRQNSNEVDLNRNFEHGWSYIEKSTEHRQYSGEGPADQPETIAIQSFITEIRPEIGIWYHQDANVISAGGARKAIPLRYAKLVGLAVGSVPCSQRCTGTAGSFANSTIAGSTNFLVELPGSDQVTGVMVRAHAQAVLSVILL